MQTPATFTPQMLHRGDNDGHIHLFRGVLSLRGNAVNDLMRVYEVGDELIRAEITAGGHTKEKTFERDDVKYIVFKGYWGDDTIKNETDIRSTIFGGAGNDVILGGRNNDRIFASYGDDEVDAGAGRDYVSGGRGNDLLNGGDGRDKMNGGRGDDTMNGGAGYDSMFGMQDDDTMNGGADGDYINGGSGNDDLSGGSGNDFISGWYGNDTLAGNEGNDKLHGGIGNDEASGGEGNDRLIGSWGDDTLRGGAGMDSLFGGSGDDDVEGNEGADRFLITKQDNILDFSDEDAKVFFRGSHTYTVYLRGSRHVFSAASFSEREIMRVDHVLGHLVERAGSNVLIKQHDGGDLTFNRHGRLLNRRYGFSSWNEGDGDIHLTSASFSSTSWLHQGIFHQIGHNFDTKSENDQIESFRAISDWEFNGSRWTFDEDSRFVRNYGTASPFEDFTTSFAAYFSNLSNQRYRGRPAGNYGIGAQAAPAKMDWLSDWIDSL